jgi:hypothetical protein
MTIPEMKQVRPGDTFLTNLEANGIDIALNRQIEYLSQKHKGKDNVSFILGQSSIPHGYSEVRSAVDGDDSPEVVDSNSKTDKKCS